MTAETATAVNRDDGVTSLHSCKEENTTSPLVYKHRLATIDDVNAIEELMLLSIEENMKHVMSTKEIERAKQSMGIDRTLIEDQTYFVIETTATKLSTIPHTTVNKDSIAAPSGSNNTIMVGCGGWGKRQTLYGGDTSVGRDDRFSDPTKGEAARIRAMYTHPKYTRRGIGTMLIQLSEEAAKAEGFTKIELGSTVVGEPLYKKNGYHETGRHAAPGGTICCGGSANGNNVVIEMSKSLM